jgi:hypothetical protein
MMAGMAGTSGTADDDAFAALFEEHYEPLVRLARLLVDDRGSGEEVVQDAFVRSVVSHTFIGHVTRLAADSTGARLLALVDGGLLVWSQGDGSFAVLGEGVTDAAWISSG